MAIRQFQLATLNKDTLDFSSDIKRITIGDKKARKLAAFERGGDALQDASRSAMADQLAAARVLAAERLAATVAALEGIRLDLLRLQMGSAPIESVTATLDAARQIGERIGESIAAQREVDRLLDNSRVRTGALPSLAALPFDDDADTPVHGVSATRG